jgi:hypothetical protein
MGFMVFNATSNNISVITWQSVLLVEETRETVESKGMTGKYNVKLLNQEVSLANTM